MHRSAVGEGFGRGRQRACVKVAVEKFSSRVKPGGWEMSLEGFCSNSQKKWLYLGQVVDSGNGGRYFWDTVSRTW